MSEGDKENSMDESSDWTRAVDRGGLIHIDDMVYSAFISIELVVRQHLTSKMAEEEGLHKIVGIIVSDEDVLFCWALVSASWEEDIAQVLLRLIAEHWITLRGFSFAKSVMERYKKRAKRTVQKSKGIRKQLQTTATQEKGANLDDFEDM